MSAKCCTVDRLLQTSEGVLSGGLQFSCISASMYRVGDGLLILVSDLMKTNQAVIATIQAGDTLMNPII